MLLIYQLLTTDTVERGTAPLFLLVGYVKFAYCVFERLTEKRGKKTACGGKGISKPHGEWENWWGLVGGWPGGGGRTSYSSSPLYSWRNIKRERKLLFLPEEKHVT